MLEANDSHKHSKYLSFLLKNLVIWDIIGSFIASSDESKFFSQ